MKKILFSILTLALGLSNINAESLDEILASLQQPFLVKAVKDVSANYFDYPVTITPSDPPVEVIAEYVDESTISILYLGDSIAVPANAFIPYIPQPIQRKYQNTWLFGQESECLEGSSARLFIFPGKTAVCIDYGSYPPELRIGKSIDHICVWGLAIPVVERFDENNPDRLDYDFVEDPDYNTIIVNYGAANYVNSEFGPLLNLEKLDVRAATAPLKLEDYIIHAFTTDAEVTPGIVQIPCPQP